MTVTVIHGDARRLPFADGSISAVVCDPPYGLANTTSGQIAETLARWVGGERDYTPVGYGFMNHEWDGFVPPVTVWDEAMRVLKPGAYLLAFAGTRTADLTGIAIRLAGFDIRDTVADMSDPVDVVGPLAWVHGQGFPKGGDVGKAIDRQAGADRETVGLETVPATDQARQWDGWGTTLKPSYEPIIVARKPLAGSVVANVLEYGTGALNIKAAAVPHGPDVNLDAIHRQHAANPLQIGGAKPGDAVSTYKPGGRWPSNIMFTHSPSCDDVQCVDGCPVAELDRQSGNRPGSARTSRNHQGGQMGWKAGNGPGFDDSGGASRFFPTFRYQAKAPSSERPTITDGGAEFHPTVKPLQLMRWLVRLVTPPDGLVLDQFAGSGTTGEACLIEGFDCVLVENYEPYLPMIRQRLARHGWTLFG